MKSCPKCGRSYTDQDINFCLDDGELLSRLSEPSFGTPGVDYEPPTVMMDQARVTRESNWPTVEQPLQQWQPPAPPQPMAFQVPASPDQTLAVVSLSTGIASLTIGWCCSLGLLFGPASIVTGLIALNQSKKDPEKYGGRGLAIGGIVTGALYLAIYIVIIVLYGAALFFGSLAN